MNTTERIASALPSGTTPIAYRRLRDTDGSIADRLAVIVQTGAEWFGGTVDESTGEFTQDRAIVARRYRGSLVAGRQAVAMEYLDERAQA